MRLSIVSIVVAAALVAAAPVSAQRASLADRVTVLEQQAANNQGNIDLLNQLTQLRGELTALRAQVEELQQQNEQLRSTNRAQYLDIDGRLERLENGAVSPVAPQSGDGAAEAAPSANADAPGQARAPLISGVPTSGDERGAYDAAFAALRGGQYADAARLFTAFLQDYPAGAYAPNALYWLGESHYVNQEYGQAQRQFQALIQRYPDDDKAPGALLKVGLSQYGRQELDAAEATLAQVVSRYPGTDAARAADDRLRAIRIGRLR